MFGAVACCSSCTHGYPCGWFGATDSVVVNDRGRPHTDPCDEYCGPLDVLSWYAAASRELQAAETQRGNMTEQQRQRLDYLRAAFDDLPSRAVAAAPVTMVDRDAVTRAAASIAGQARQLLVELGAPAPGGAPTLVVPTPIPGEEGDGLDLPDLLPTLPTLPKLDGLTLLLLVAALGLAGGLFLGGRRDR